jgi:hypothetical protein
MSARIPLDVDLEDKLLYGLTPTRLAYLVVGLLAAFSVWSTQWAPAWVRGVCALILACAGAVAGWGRWRGRPADGWVVDIATYLIATYRLRWSMPRLRR